MAESIHINGIPFNSKIVAKKHIQQLLSKYGYGDKIESNDFPFFLSLIEKHENSSEKIGAGIKELQVRVSQRDNKNKVIYIIRIDSSEIDISWRKCITNPSPLSRVKDAARNLVRSQIDDFREQCFAGNETISCAETFTEIDKELCAIDHCHPKTFNHIFKTWCVSEKVNGKEIQTEDIINTLDKTFTDEVLRNSWLAFHQQHAILRAVHYKVNLSLGSGPAKEINIPLEGVNDDELYENYREQDWGM